MALSMVSQVNKHLYVIPTIVISKFNFHACTIYFSNYSQIKEETQPAVATTLSLLDNCKSEEEILVVIKNAAISEKLWPDELPLYFEALCRMRSKFKMAKFMQRNEQPTDRIIFSEIKLQEYSSYVLLKDPYFQHLLLKTLQQSPLYLTKELVHLFRHFTHIQISPDSNAMSYLIHVMQNRINDFFPVVCHLKKKLS